MLIVLSLDGMFDLNVIYCAHTCGLFNNVDATQETATTLSGPFNT